VGVDGGGFDAGGGLFGEGVEVVLGFGLPAIGQHGLAVGAVEVGGGGEVECDGGGVTDLERVVGDERVVGGVGLEDGVVAGGVGAIGLAGEHECVAGGSGFIESDADGDFAGGVDMNRDDVVGMGSEGGLGDRGAIGERVGIFGDTGGEVEFALG
jgi:hypothetical protein